MRSFRHIDGRIVGSGRRVAATLALLLALAAPALALSEIKPDENAPPPADESETSDPVIRSVPLPPPPGIPAAPAHPAGGDEAAPDGTGTDPSDPTRPHVDPDGPVPDVLTDLSTLPEPVRRMRELILEATRGGDIEKLRPLLGTGDGATLLTYGDTGGDLIDYLKQMSGDGEGHEILAILEEVLEAGFVHLDAGQPGELYVWPYFFAVPLEKLTPAQKVELFRIVTAGDYEDMKTYGAYIFYRVGITPDGRWSFFVAGD